MLVLSSKLVPGGSGSSLSTESLARLRSRARVLLGEALPTQASGIPAPAIVDAQGTTADAIQAEAADTPATRRQAARRKTMISGKLVFGEMNSVIDCFVRDLSDTGARISLPNPTPLPPVFMLRFNNGEYHRCRVQRRSGLEIGVQFLD